MEYNKITMTNVDGIEVECDVLLTFDSEETKKSYIVYTDNTVDEFGSVQVYASVYDPMGSSMDLMPVETDKEWDAIDNILASVQDKLEKKA